MYRQLDALEAAAELYRKALAVRPDHPPALQNLGLVLSQLKRYEEAVGLHQRAIENDPGNVQNHYALSQVYKSMGRSQEAVETLKKALAIKPLGDGFRRLGQMLYALHRVEEAAANYEAWLRMEPGNPIAKHMLAACTQKDVPVRAGDAFVTGVRRLCRELRQGAAWAGISRSGAGRRRLAADRWPASGRAAHRRRGLRHGPPGAAPAPLRPAPRRGRPFAEDARESGQALAVRRAGHGRARVLPAFLARSLRRGRFVGHARLLRRPARRALRRLRCAARAGGCCSPQAVSPRRRRPKATASILTADTAMPRRTCVGLSPARASR